MAAAGGPMLRPPTRRRTTGRGGLETDHGMWVWTLWSVDRERKKRGVDREPVPRQGPGVTRADSEPVRTRPTRAAAGVALKFRTLPFDENKPETRS
jgi:hypothetical protein